MMDDKSKFISFEMKRGGKVTIRDNTTCEILRSSTIRTKISLSIKKVLFVDSLKHNMHNISQLCDKVLTLNF